MNGEVIVRNRGRRDSLFLLALALLLGFLPVAAYITRPGTTRTALLLGLALGLPLFFLSLRRLKRMEALLLSRDGKTLTLLRSDQDRLDLPAGDVKFIELAGVEATIGTRAGLSIALEVDDPRAADVALNALASRLGVPYSASPD